MININVYDFISIDDKLKHKVNYFVQFHANFPFFYQRILLLLFPKNW